MCAWGEGECFPSLPRKWLQLWDGSKVVLSMVWWVILSQAEIYVHIINCRDRVSSLKNNYNKTKCNMYKAIPCDQLSSGNASVFPFQLPRKPFPAICPGIIHSLWWVGKRGVDMISDLILCDLNPLLSPPERAPQANWQIPVFSSLRIKAQGKPPAAHPEFLISPWCRKFKGFSFLIFYLPQSISWHIWSKNLVSWYFFQEHYLLAALSQSPSLDSPLSSEWYL